MAVEVVDSFELLGITIDIKLNFEKYANNLRKSINKRRYSINDPVINDNQDFDNFNSFMVFGNVGDWLLANVQSPTSNDQK
ncbi:hypothetical protein BpHYR1_019697, partial [Brachionus plicatilis]